ncbi:ras-related protein Rab-24-like [Homarus americanus]|uniref:ras-related protein Rab-24-like n=1 Tax=Homarus americanus TaxID=6706 RepID=UPI001C466CC0|nr:ras-related protein Rab-24-like [Homarus americanus]XP_042217970.1 ras-related protein Rab-24-like [Homarus americanus]
MSGKVDMKVVMLGQAACGKTSLVERFIYNRFNTNYQTTIGAAFGARNMAVQGKQICVGLWDTAGSERYEAMSRIYYRDAKAAVICYDITNAESADRAKFWVSEVQKHEEDCKIYLCGTKLDLAMDKPQERQVDFHDLSDYAEEVGAKVIETSSKTGNNVEKLFNCVVEDFAVTNADVMATLENSTITLHNNKKKKGCC